MPVLFQIGLLQVEVINFNITEFEHEVGADFAAKAVVGAAKPREFVGEADDELQFRGKLFPQSLGGLDEIDLVLGMAKSGAPQMVVRGDGVVYGWYLIERFKAAHTTLNAEGVGREISHDIKLVRSSVAATADAMLATVFGLFG